MKKYRTDKKIIVIGGGASGLMAAGQAASLGVETILFLEFPERKRKGGLNIFQRWNLMKFIKT